MTPAYLAVETVEFCNDLCDELYWTLDEALNLALNSPNRFIYVNQE